MILSQTGEFHRSFLLISSMMFRIVSKNLLQVTKAGDSTIPSRFLRNPCRRIVSSISSTPSEKSFTVSYLINSCGLPREAAISASKKIRLRNSEKPNSVLILFRIHGFTNNHISKIIKREPHLLLFNADKTLKPKFDFFKSIGLSGGELAKLIYLEPSILSSSLVEKIIPSFEFLRSILHTHENVIAPVKRLALLLKSAIAGYLAPNIRILRDIGVPESNISKFFMTQRRTIITKPERFNELVKEVKEMGFNPLQSKFVKAVQGLSGMTKLTREQKFEAYRRWGWSDNEILSAFRKEPTCVMISEKKITRAMDFIVNKMGYKSLDIAWYPITLLFSFEKRTRPRYLVIQVLWSKGLIEKNLYLSTVLQISEKKFLDRYVTKYQVEVPNLLDVYQGKVD